MAKHTFSVLDRLNTPHYGPFRLNDPIRPGTEFVQVIGHPSVQGFRA